MCGLAYQFLNNKKKGQNVMSQKLYRKRGTTHIWVQENFFKRKYGKTSMFNM